MFEFIWLVWQGITRSMRLDPAVAQFVEQRFQSGGGNTGWIILTIAILGGAGLLLGQSVILFVNRVSPGRFFLSLLLNGLVFTISLIVWAFFIWVIGLLVFPESPRFGLVMRLVGLSAAPYVFGLLVLIPYLGEGIYRILGIWSMLIAAGATAFSFKVGWWPALAVVGLSWLAIWVMSNTIARPVIALRNKAWQLAAGTSLDADVSDILTQFAVDPNQGPNSKGGK
jgi:hypothetical protein